MNIRYFRADKRRYWVAYGKTMELLQDNGYIFLGKPITVDPGELETEILPPDPGPIEERYIKATDRPSVQGFKYPELHPVNDVES